MASDRMGKDEILAAIRRAAAELGRAPSRGELRRITGVSHYRVLAVFPTLRAAVRVAGLEPNPKGEKISTADLLADWKRVAEKLGRRPSRAEYVREGRYSAGALTVRFGSWGKIEKKTYHGGTETRRGRRSGHREIGTSDHQKGEAVTSYEPLFNDTRSRPTGRMTRINETSNEPNHKGDEGPRRESGLAQSARVAKPDESVLRDFDRVLLAALPAPVVGMRRVTVEVAQMVVNTLMGGNQQSAISIQPRANPFTTEVTEEHGGEDSRELTRNTRMRAGKIAPRGVKKDRPVMGEPFDRSPMTNAPVNELGVMVLFGMVAARLGLQVESVQGKFPDCLAKRQVAPGKWQHLRIEFEYESKNFRLHGHDPKGCDMIVCWRHNWKDCPAEIEVVELCRLFGM